ncbi:hypothetical protein CsatA_010513 [Cannabis sativa]
MITSTKNSGDKEKRKCLMKSDLGVELKRVAFDVQEFALEVMLSSEILNVVWDMLTRAERLGSKGGRKRWFLNTSMSCSISVDKLFPSTVKGNRDGGKESAQQFYIGDLAICKEILIPMHKDMHFNLFNVSVEHEEVEIWDSLLNNGKSSGEDMVKPVMAKLDSLLATDIATLKLFSEKTSQSKWLNFSFTRFNVKTITIPRQTNSYDCGIFVIKWLEHRSVVDSKFHSHNERARIAVKIVTSKMNKLKDKVNFASLRDRKPFTQCANS